MAVSFRILLLALLALTLQGGAPLDSLPAEPVRIAGVGEAGTLKLADGREVRLAGIAVRTIAALKKYTGRDAALRLLDPPENRYRQILAQIVLDDSEWLQEALVKEGAAVVMPVYERDSVRLAALLAAEKAARLSGDGIWGQGGQIVSADNASQAFDRFAIVQGRVEQAAEVRGVIYLNFGEDYRTDFTISIPKRALAALGPEVAETVTRLTAGENPDMVAEARGWVFWNGGPMIAAETYPQLVFREAASPLAGERRQ